MPGARNTMVRKIGMTSALVEVIVERRIQCELSEQENKVAALC